MAKQITAPVGNITTAGNLYDDVVTVQELLNNVPTSEGGPQPRLDVDGNCGPKTRAAIQAFQLKQFGWSLADGRVDPFKQTIARLNEFDKASASPSQSFRIRRNFDTPYILSATEGSFNCFEVADTAGGTSAVYFFGNKASMPMKPAVFAGQWVSFTTSYPYPVTGLECPASYTTFYVEGSAPVNMLALQLKPGVVIVKGFLTSVFIASLGPEVKTHDLNADFTLMS